jgi:hypothetical protein
MDDVWDGLGLKDEGEDWDRVIRRSRSRTDRPIGDLMGDVLNCDWWDPDMGSGQSCSNTNTLWVMFRQSTWLHKPLEDWISILCFTRPYCTRMAMCIVDYWHLEVLAFSPWTWFKPWTDQTKPEVQFGFSSGSVIWTNRMGGLVCHLVCHHGCALSIRPTSSTSASSTELRLFTTFVYFGYFDYSAYFYSFAKLSISAR